MLGMLGPDTDTRPAAGDSSKFAAGGSPETRCLSTLSRYDWLRDGLSIRGALAAVASVMSQLPFDEQAWQRTWLNRDPKPALIPIFGHRYVVADETQSILSIDIDPSEVWC